MHDIDDENVKIFEVTVLLFGRVKTGKWVSRRA